MPKLHSRFVCQQCGKVTSKSFGRCPQCGSYASMVEEVITAPAASARTGNSLSLVNESPKSLGGDHRRRGGALCPAHRRVRPRAGRRDRARLHRAGGRRPGDRQIHPAAADGHGSCPAGEGAVCLRRGIGAPDQDARPAADARGGNAGGRFPQPASADRDQPGCDPAAHR